MKKALVCISLGLFFGICSGLGFYAVSATTGMLEQNPPEVEAAISQDMEGKMDEEDIAEKGDAETVAADDEEDIQKQIDDVIAASKERLGGEEGPTVLYLRVSASALYAKNSKDSVLGEMLAALGCRNIADDDESLLETVSVEHILETDPDYIFTVQLGSDTEGTKQHIETMGYSYSSKRRQMASSG